MPRVTFCKHAWRLECTGCYVQNWKLRKTLQYFTKLVDYYWLRMRSSIVCDSWTFSWVNFAIFWARSVTKQPKLIYFVRKIHWRTPKICARPKLVSLKSSWKWFLWCTRFGAQWARKWAQTLDEQKSIIQLWYIHKSPRKKCIWHQLAQIMFLFAMWN